MYFCRLGVHKVNSNLIAEAQGTHLVKSPKVISLDVFSIILLSDSVPGPSLLVILPDVFSIILLSDCVPGPSLLVISPDVLSIILISEYSL